MNYDSEYCCDRCKRRIKKGEEVWLGGKPFGPQCAQIIRKHATGLPPFETEAIPELQFDKFQTSGITYEFIIE